MQHLDAFDIKVKKFQQELLVALVEVGCGNQTHTSQTLLKVPEVSQVVEMKENVEAGGAGGKHEEQGGGRKAPGKSVRFAPDSSTQEAEDI